MLGHTYIDHSMIVWFVTDKLSFVFNNLNVNIQERQMKKKARLSKMYGMHQKQFLEGSL